MEIRSYSSNGVQYYIHKLTLLLIMGELGMRLYQALFILIHYSLITKAKNNVT